MANHGPDSTSELRGSGTSGRGRMRADVRRGVLVVSLAGALLLGITSAASAASFNWYWYAGGNENCWQTGQLGSGSQGCDNVGAGFLEVPGRLFNVSEGGIDKDVSLSPSGDYCSYYAGSGVTLNKQDSSNESGITGFGTPAPYGSYQEWDGKGDVCQAYGQGFGQEITKSSCSLKTCGMAHYASFYQQGYNDQPWSGVFGSPSLVVSTQADVQTLSGSSPKGWGYVCPIFQDMNPPHSILEYCLQEWRGSGNAKPEWEDERIGSCAGGPSHNAIDTVQTFFYEKTQFAENLGPSTTGVASAGWKSYSARITETNLKHAIELDRKPYKEKAGNGSGEATPELGFGCGREHELSAEPKAFALIGVEQGAEGWSYSQLGAAAYNLQLHDEYTPLPPEATTSAASEVQEEQATLNGNVTPKGTDTHYYFQYGETPTYGLVTSEGDAGSGMGSAPESATVTGLQPGMTYHYRVVATSSGGTSYGSDQSFITPSAPASIFDPSGNGNLYVGTEGANHALYVAVNSGGVWSGPYQEAAPGSVLSAPTVSRDESKNVYWTYEGPEHSVEQLVRNSVGEWSGPTQLVAPNQKCAPPTETVGCAIHSAVSASSDGKGHLFWTYEGPEHAVDVLVGAEVKGQKVKIEGPYQLVGAGTKCVGNVTVSCSMYSAASSSSDGKGHLFWTYEGPEHALDVLVRSETGVEGPYQLVGANQKCAKPMEATSCSAYSAVSSGIDSAGDFYWSYQGPGNAFDLLVRKPAYENSEHKIVEAKVEGPYQEAGPENMYSASSTSSLDSKGNFYWFFNGRNNTLDVMERFAKGEVGAVQRIGGEGTTT